MTKFRQALAVLLLLSHASSGHAFVSFGETRFMHPDGGSNSREDGAVSLATDGSGHWVAATDGPFVSTSSDNGDTWTTPALLPGGDYYFGALYTDPMVATDRQGTWLLTRMKFDPGVGNDQILVWRSTDNGATWGTAVDLVSAAGTSYEARPRIATDGAGKWMVVWEAVDPLHGDKDIGFATSPDNGLTWSAPGWVNSDATTDTLDDDYPSVATDGAGNWVVVYGWFGDGVPPATWQVRAIRSTDFGANWSTPVPFSTHLGLTWADVVSGGPGVFVSLHTKTAAIVGRSTDGGATWTAKTISGTWATANAHPSHLDTDGNGEWVAVWDTDADPLGTGGGDVDIAYSRSTDNGITWSTPSFVDPDDAATDATPDSMPAIASDGAGRWIAAWQRTAGPSLDLVLSISDPLCPPIRRNDCITGALGKSSIGITDADGTAKDKMKVKIGKAGETALADFGDPTSTDDLLLCLWDSSGDVDTLLWRATLPAGGTCDGAACWKTAGAGYGFKDKLTENSAFTKAKLSSGAAGSAGVSVQLAGTRLRPPAPPYDNDSSVAVQLISEQSGKCWGATFTTPKTNAGGKYSAKSN